MTTVERIKEISKKYGLNLKTTAIKAGLSENAIYKWNNQKPNSEALSAVAKVLNVSTDYLLGNTDEMTSKNINKMPKVDLYKVDDSERDELVSANGQPISDEDWVVIKAILSKYPKKHEE